MWRLLAGAVALAAVVGSYSGSFNAQSPQPGAGRPFLTAAAAPTADREMAARRADPTVVRERYVSANLQMIADTGRAGAEAGAVRPRLVLNLFDDVAVVAVLDAYDEGAGGRAWRGHVEGVGLSSVTLVTTGDLLAGSIASPQAVYAIRTLPGGLQVVSEVDQSRFLPELAPIPAPAAAGAAALPGEAQPHADSGGRIDVLVLYTTAAKNSPYAGSTALMENRIALGISETNQSYANSGVTQRLRLVGTQEVSGYSDNNDLGQDLSAVRNSATSVGATAASLRNSLGADLVVFITYPASPNGCGIAYFMSSVWSGFAPNAFSVVENSCVSPYYSFGHEMGHNMGATHDWYVDDGTSPYTYIHGFVNTAAGNRFRTIMSYNNLCSDQGFNCTRVLYWSNPSVTYGGAAMGIPGGTKIDCLPGHPSNVSCDADNHRVLDNTAYTVANFRQEAAAPTSPPVVTVHPKDTAVVVGGTASFTSAASGSPTPSVQWMKKPSGGVFSYIANSQGLTTYSFTAALSDSGSQYKAEFQNNLYSPVYSNAATLTVLPPFSDDPLVAGTTAVKVAHIAELRARIAALRARHSLSVYAFTDDPLTAGTTVITATHINQLREALAAVYAAAGSLAPSYTDSPLTAGTAIKAVHISQLRDAVIAIE